MNFEKILEISNQIVETNKIMQFQRKRCEDTPKHELIDKLSWDMEAYRSELKLKKLCEELKAEVNKDECN